jgi:hypothetical protein
MEGTRAFTDSWRSVLWLLRVSGLRGESGTWKVQIGSIAEIQTETDPEARQR